MLSPLQRAIHLLFMAPIIDKNHYKPVSRMRKLRYPEVATVSKWGFKSKPRLWSLSSCFLLLPLWLAWWCKEFSNRDVNPKSPASVAEATGAGRSPGLHVCLENRAVTCPSQGVRGPKLRERFGLKLGVIRKKMGIEVSLGWMYQFPTAAIMSPHIGWLKATGSYSLKVWKLKVPNQGVGEPGSP